MSNFQKHLDPKSAVDASTVVDSSTPWKDRIIEFLINNDEPAQTPKAILEATDSKYTVDNFEKRKHCLDSQLTYIRKDYNIRTKQVDDKIALIGVQQDDKIIPFKNALALL